VKYLKPIISIALLLSLSCAVNDPPPGGPVDTIPPSIVSVQPENGSVNISQDAVFKIKFSESMERAKLDGAVFLSPVFWDYPRLKWSGRELIIIPPEKLHPNTTYILTIGADAADANRVKMGHSQSFAFSTGAIIDSGSISGKVFFEDKQRIYYDIWAYSVSDTLLDFMSRIPDYATQVDSAGNFSVDHLNKGDYLVICIDDKNDDLFWDPSSEVIGFPPSLLDLTEERAVGGFVFRPERHDTALAAISRVTPINGHRLAIEFSEPPDESLRFEPKNYQIRYFEGDSILESGFVYAGEADKLILETEPLADNITYRLIVPGLRTSSGMPFDTAGIRFTGIETPDTIGPNLLSANPPDRSSDVYQDSVIDMVFSERVLALSFPNAVAVVADSTDTLRFIVGWPLPNVARLRVSGHVPREKVIAVTLNPALIYDTFRNRMPDSAITFSFRLPPADTAGSVTATMNLAGQGPYLGELIPLSRGESYKAQFNRAGKITFESVMPGNYRFEFFEDSDSSGKWFGGLVSPLRFAEPFSFLPDTIQVRSRWDTDIGDISLPGNGH